MNPRIFLSRDEIGSVTKDRVIESLVGTEDATAIAASLSESRLGLNILGDELFNRYIGNSLGKQLYVRGSAAESLVGSIVHEGKHGLDELAEFGRRVPQHGASGNLERYVRNLSSIKPMAFRTNVLNTIPLTRQFEQPGMPKESFVGMKSTIHTRPDSEADNA